MVQGGLAAKMLIEQLFCFECKSKRNLKMMNHGKPDETVRCDSCVTKWLTNRIFKLEDMVGQKQKVTSDKKKSTK